MSDNGGKKSMQHTRLVKCALGAGLVLSFGIFGKYMVSSSTTMGSETELAGMAYMLDQYCTIQVGATQSNPEAIVAFEDMPGNTNNGTSAVSGFRRRSDRLSTKSTKKRRNHCKSFVKCLILLD